MDDHNLEKTSNVYSILSFLCFHSMTSFVALLMNVHVMCTTAKAFTSFTALLMQLLYLIERIQSTYVCTYVRTNERADLADLRILYNNCCCELIVPCCVIVLCVGLGMSREDAMADYEGRRGSARDVLRQILKEREAKMNETV